MGLTLALIANKSLAENLLGLLPARSALNAVVLTVFLWQILNLISLAFCYAKTSPSSLLTHWAATTFALAPMMQTTAISDKDVINYPRPGASFNAIAFNLCLGLAGYFGGIMISPGNLKSLPLIALFVVLIAIPIVLVRFLGSQQSARIHFTSQVGQTL